jgi:hypothetical protein
LAVDPSGNAIAVWSQSDGGLYGRYNIWANRYTPAGGWGAAELIETDSANTSNAEQPVVAIDPNGNALAVWRQIYRGAFQIWSNRYTPTGGWGTAALIGPVAAEALGPQVAVDANGNALAVWHQKDIASLDGRSSIWANRYTPTGGWGTAELIETDDRGHAGGAQVAIDANGNALAVWAQSDRAPSGRSYVWYNRYTPSGGWGTAARIVAAGDAGAVRMAMDPDGNAVAVWRQYDGVRSNLWASRYNPLGGWGTAEPIEARDEPAQVASVAMDPDGNALVVWQQGESTPSNLLNIWANRFSPLSGWAGAELITMNDAGQAGRPDLAIDQNGSALAVWGQRDSGRSDIWANRYTPASGWGTAELIEANDVGDAFAPQVAIDPSGNAVSAWMQWDGIRYNIWANKYE